MLHRFKAPIALLILACGLSGCIFPGYYHHDHYYGGGGGYGDHGPGPGPGPGGYQHP